MRNFLLFFTILTGVVTFIILWMTQGEDNVFESKRNRPPAISQAEETKAQQEATIGGKFNLTDQQGRRRSDLDFRGQVMLVFFGFTHCPDICPVTVSTLSTLMEQLGDKASQVAPIFITVDPERDTPQVLKTYLQNFDSRIVALTGMSHEIKDVAKHYKVYFAKRTARDDALPKEHAESEPDESTALHNQHQADADHDAHAHHQMHQGDSDYNMDHSGYIYLMDKEGRYVQHFPYSASAEEIGHAVKPLLD